MNSRLLSLLCSLIARALSSRLEYVREAESTVDSHCDQVVTERLAITHRIGLCALLAFAMSNSGWGIASAFAQAAQPPVIMSATQTQKPVFAGTGEPGATIEVRTTDGLIRNISTTVSADGSWTVADNSYVLSNGSYPFYAWELGGGHFIGYSAPVTVTVSGVTSEITITSITPPPRKSGLWVVTGKAPAGATVHFDLLDGVGDTLPGTLGEVTADVRGDWTAQPWIESEPGDYLLGFWGTKIDGTPATNPGVVLVSVPAAPVITSADTSSTVQFSGTGQPGATIEVFSSDYLLHHATTTVAANGTWQLDPSWRLANGSYSFLAEQTISGSAPQWSAPFSVTVANAAPTGPHVTIDHIVPVSVGGFGPWTLSGTAPAGATVTLTLYDSVGSTLPGTLGTTVADGSGNWSATTNLDTQYGDYVFTAGADNAPGPGLLVFRIPTRPSFAPNFSARVLGYRNASINPVQIAATGFPTTFRAPGLAAYGLSIDANGVISGTPTATGTSTIQVIASNDQGDSDPLNVLVSILSLPITSPTIAVTPPGSDGIGTWSMKVTAPPSSHVILRVVTPNAAVNDQWSNEQGFDIGSNGEFDGQFTIDQFHATGTYLFSVTETFPATAWPVTGNPTAAARFDIAGAVPVVTDTAVVGAIGTPIAAVTVQATGAPTNFSAPDLVTYGLTINSNGQITGTPSKVADDVAVNVTASNGAGTSAPAKIYLQLYPTGPLMIDSVTGPKDDADPSGWVIVGSGPAGGHVLIGNDGPSTLFNWQDEMLPVGVKIDDTGHWTMRRSGVSVAGTYNLRVEQIYSEGHEVPGAVSNTVTYILPHATATNPPPSGNPPPADNPPPVGGKASQTITFSSPVSAIVVGQPIQLGALSSAGLPITYTVVNGDATISGSTLTPTSTATLIVRASSGGSDTVNAASVDVNFGTPQKAGQAIKLATSGGAVPAEKPVTLSATADSGLPVTYTVVSGPATISGNTLTFTGTGNVTVRASQTGDATHAAASDATLTFTANPVNRLVNLSSRVHVSAGDASQGAIAGFAVTGDVPKQILIRAVGPTLAAFGISTGIAAPQLTVFDAKSNVVASNSGWNNDAQIAAAGSGVGAFGLGANSKDAAVLLTLAPGLYTAQVQSSTDGMVLIEVYDVSANAAVPTKQLINISTRGVVGTGDNVLVAGFVVAGNDPKRVLIRAVGPGLAAFGVGGTLSDPVLKLYDAHSVVLARNDNWETTTAGDVLPLTTTAADVSAADTASGAFALAPGSKDAALVVTLPPGQYSAIVSGANNTSGAAIVEVYELP